MKTIIELFRSEPNAAVVFSTLLLVTFFKIGYETIKNGFRDTQNTDPK